MALVATDNHLQPVVSFQEGQEKARQIGAAYFRFTGKDRREAEQPFSYVARQLVKSSEQSLHVPAAGKAGRGELPLSRWSWLGMSKSIHGLMWSAFGPCLGLDRE